MLRNFLIRLSTSDSMRRFATDFGPVRRVVRRFIAGETIDDAVAAVKELNARGIKTLMNEVGESVTTQAGATQAAKAFHTLLQRIDDEGLDSHVTLKPSHVGMTFGRDFFYENVVDIVRAAQTYGNTLEIDIEASPDVQDTIDVYHRLLDTFGGGVRLAIQTYLHRTYADVQRITERGGSVRLVKGAYNESPDIAYQSKKEIDQATIQLMETILDALAEQSEITLILGSHDPKMIEWLIRETEARGIGKDRFEIQMLMGVRRDEQQRLAALGYQVRVYVPYGDAWYPYFMRRMAEYPANILLIGRAMLGK